MKKILLTCSLIVLTILTATAQDVTGKWKTIDDETGEAKSIVEIYKQNATNARERTKTNRCLAW